MKHLPENYQPKGYLEGFPLNIIDKMIDEQIAQGNRPDVTVFEHDAGQNKKGGGFDWSLSRQKEEYWQEVIGNRNFDDPDPTEQEPEQTTKPEPPSEEMSKRLKVAMATMSLNPELINISFEDEDMVQDDEGGYTRTLNGVYYSYFENKINLDNADERRYSVRPESTYEKRFVRALYRIADELIRQEDEK